jgi:hypothetical protein
MLSRIRRLALCAAAVTALAWAFSGAAKAQDVPYMLGYYSHANTAGVPDGTLRLVNDGNQGDTPPGGDLCASIYVFDNNENMQECCSCLVTPNGYLSLSVDTSLTHAPTNPVILHTGVIKVVSSHPNKFGACNPTLDAPVIGIRGWLTHIDGPPFQLSVEDLKDSTFGALEEVDLGEDCGKTKTGSAGVCSCTDVGR